MAANRARAQTPPLREFREPRAPKPKKLARECGLCGWGGKTTADACPECSTPLSWGKELAE